MINFLREWIINICTAVFFITAVEMILPDNSMKKYSKFVLGLILITVFINPIISIFNKNFDMSAYTTKISREIDKNSEGSSTRVEEYKKENIRSTLETFKTNLEKNCEEKLKQKYPDGTYDVDAEVDYDTEKESVSIKKVCVSVDYSTVSVVKKVTINLQNDEKEGGTYQKKDDEIQSYLSSQLDVPKDLIQIRQA